MFFNDGVGAPDVNFYANDTKMTAISSTDSAENSIGTAYGAAGAGGKYAGIAPGQYTLSGKISGETDNHLAISSLTATLEDGKYYSFYQSGIYDPTSKTVDAFIVEDPLPAQIDYSVAYVRFVNAIGNSNPMTLYATDPNTGAEAAVGGPVPYKGAGEFVALPPGSYDLSARDPGSSTTLISSTGESFEGGRVYTVSARGDMTVTSSSDDNAPTLDNTTNR